jgi:extradiol dioxygenase family protein
MAPILHLSLPVHDLEAARHFYVDLLGCEPGRVRPDWIDVWFYAMQVTLHAEPAQVLDRDDRGVRHFGVTLSPADLAALIERLQGLRIEWLREPTTDYVGTDRGQTKAMIADPSGNAVELKTNTDPGSAFERGASSAATP